MKKRERSLLYRKFRERIQKKFKQYFYYKIPDTAGLGGKRPFDSILILRGTSFAIEFKSKGDSITPYQKECLRRVEVAGGIGMVFEDGEDMDAFIDVIDNNTHIK